MKKKYFVLAIILILESCSVNYDFEKWNTIYISDDYIIYSIRQSSSFQEIVVCNKKGDVLNEINTMLSNPIRFVYKDSLNILMYVYVTEREISDSIVYYGNNQYTTLNSRLENIVGGFNINVVYYAVKSSGKLDDLFFDSISIDKNTWIITFYFGKQKIHSCLINELYFQDEYTNRYVSHMTLDETVKGRNFTDLIYVNGDAYDFIKEEINDMLGF